MRVEGQLGADEARVLFHELSERLTAAYPAGRLLPRHRYVADEVAPPAHGGADVSAFSIARPVRGGEAVTVVGVRVLAEAAVRPMK